MYGTLVTRIAARRPGMLMLLVVLTIGALLVTGLGACGDSGDEGTGTGGDERHRCVRVRLRH